MSTPLAGTVPTDSRQPLHIRTVLARILDGSEFQEFKALFGTTLLTGFGRLYGQLVGVLANDGVLQADSALKGDVYVTYLWLLALSARRGAAEPVCRVYDSHMLADQRAALSLQALTLCSCARSEGCHLCFFRWDCCLVHVDMGRIGQIGADPV